MNTIRKARFLRGGKAFLSMAGLCLVAVAPWSQAQDNGTVRSVVLQAIEANPDVQLRFHAFQDATHEVSGARSGYLQSVDLSATIGKANRDYDGRGSYRSNQAQISLTQMLFDGFRTASQVRYFDSAQRVRFYELLNSIETTALEAVQAYEEVVRTRELVALARENYH